MRRNRSNNPWEGMVNIGNQCATDHEARRRVLGMIFEEATKFLSLPVEIVEQMIANEDRNPRPDPPHHWQNNIMPALRLFCEFNRKFNAACDKP